MNYLSIQIIVIMNCAILFILTFYFLLYVVKVSHFYLMKCMYSYANVSEQKYYILRQNEYQNYF